MNQDNAQSFLQAGDPRRALQELQASIKAHPADGRLRVFLFQLLSVLGEWDRAVNQLGVCAELDADHALMAQTYLPVVQCERLRHQVFAGRQSPMILGDPERWMAKLLEALRLDQTGEHGRAESLRRQGLEEATPTAGVIDDMPFQWFADADTRLGPMFEVIMNGRYYWVPVSRVHRIQLIPPEDLRDLVWLPAEFIWSNQGEAFGFMPVRYPGSDQDEGMLQLARRTDWVEVGDGVIHGRGQRLFATDAGEYALLDSRSIQLQSSG